MGALVTIWFTRGDHTVPLWEGKSHRNQGPLTMGASFVIIAVVVSLLWAHVLDVKYNGRSYTQLILSLLSDDERSDAWHYELIVRIAGMDPPDTTAIDAATYRLQEIIDEDPRTVYREYLAVLHYRKERFVKAVELVHGIMEDDPNRFSAALLAELYELTITKDPEGVRIKEINTKEEGGFEIVANLDEFNPGRVIVRSLIYHDKKVLGLLEMDQIEDGRASINCPFSNKLFSGRDVSGMEIIPMWAESRKVVDKERATMCRLTWIDTNL